MIDTETQQKAKEICRNFFKNTKVGQFWQAAAVKAIEEISTLHEQTAKAVAAASTAENKEETKSDETAKNN